MMFSSAPAPEQSSTAPHLALTLADLDVGAQARVLQVAAAGELGERLMEMGLVPGTPVEVVRHLQWGRLLELRLRGYHLSIRRDTAAEILVERSSRG